MLITKEKMISVIVFYKEKKLQKVTIRSVKIRGGKKRGKIREKKNTQGTIRKWQKR